MGEIADAMTDGEMCMLCGCYFTATHGYPVVCYDCWDELTSEDKEDYQRATHDTI